MNNKITDAIRKIDNLVTTDGLFGKLDTVLMLNASRWTRDEKIEMIKHYTKRCKNRKFGALLFDVYSNRIR